MLQAQASTSAPNLTLLPKSNKTEQNENQWEQQKPLHKGIDVRVDLLRVSVRWSGNLYHNESRLHREYQVSLFLKSLLIIVLWYIASQSFLLSSGSCLPPPQTLVFPLPLSLLLLSFSFSFSFFFFSPLLLLRLLLLFFLLTVQIILSVSFFLTPANPTPNA